MRMVAGIAKQLKENTSSCGGPLRHRNTQFLTIHFEAKTESIAPVKPSIFRAEQRMNLGNPPNLFCSQFSREELPSAADTKVGQRASEHRLWAPRQVRRPYVVSCTGAPRSCRPRSQKLGQSFPVTSPPSCSLLRHAALR